MQPIGNSALLPAAILTLLAGGHAAIARYFPPRARADRFLASALFAVAVPVAIVFALGHTATLTPGATTAATFGIGAATWVASGRRGRTTAGLDAVAAVGILRSALFGGTWSIGAWVGVVALGLAVIAAWLLPVWAWDALGYHLPVVHDALLTQRLRVVPTHVPYVNAYPGAVDLYFVWWRALLPDDTWIELAQLPFAWLGVVATTTLASRAGVPLGRGLGWSLAFLAVPAVMLELATNYVDIAYGALLSASVCFLLHRSLDRGGMLLGGVALGLFLGTKPSAPVPFAIVAGAAMIQHRRRLLVPAAALALALALGAFTYVENQVRYGNPVWPVRITLGPISLPGIAPGGYFFDLGVPEPYRSYGLARRLMASWYHWPSRFVYDTRIGGFGPVVGLLLIPIALSVLVNNRRALRSIAAAWVTLVITSLATPAAFWARYTLAFPVALLVAGAAGTRKSAPRSRRFVETMVGVAAAAGVISAAPGLTDNRVSLLELLAMPAGGRAAVFGGIDGDEAEWMSARNGARSGGAIAYDQSLGLPGRLWDGVGATPIVYLGDRRLTELAETLEREHVTIAVLGERAARAVARSGLELEALFVCSLDPCTVYRVVR